MNLTAFDDFEAQRKKPEISMAPLIDMVFLLLIFFVVTTTFTRETGIQVDKARAASSQPITKNLLVIALDKDGQYWYDKKMRNLEEVTNLAVEQSAANKDLNIVIVPDKNGRIDPLIRLMDRLRGRDLHRFSLGTQLTDKDK